ALDATYSIGDALSGVGIYSREILRGIAEAHPDAQFDWCYRVHRMGEARRQQLPPNVRRRLLFDPFAPLDSKLFHGLNQRLPRIPMHRAVATFHDLFVLTGEYSTAEFRARFAAQARAAAWRADAIIAVSAFTKRQVVELLGVVESKVHVVHHGVCSTPMPVVPRENIVLTVGAIQTRKNTARLVEAFEALDGHWGLVLAGSNGYGAEAIRERIARSPARDRIQVTGYVSAAELSTLYARAKIFAFPSLDEGFGMPVLEGMQAGIPVITSNRSALPEVANDAALLIDPNDTDALADALQRVAHDEGLAQQLVERGLNRVKAFGWGEAVGETWKIYQRLLA